MDVFRSALVYSLAIIRLSQRHIGPPSPPVDSMLHPRGIASNVCSGLVELIEVSVRWPRIESGGREGEFVNGDDSTECFLLFWKKKWKEGEGVISRSGSRRRWLGAMENIFEELDRDLRGKFRIVATFVRCRWRYRAPLQNFSSLLFRSEFNFFTRKFS